MRLSTAGVCLMVITSIFSSGCDTAEETQNARVFDADLQALIDSVVADDPAIRGAALAVVSPTLGIEWRERPVSRTRKTVRP